MKWGVIFAVAVILWTAAVHMMGFYTVRIEYADVVDRFALVLPAAAVTFALVEQRRALNGRLAFSRGVLTGVAVAAVSAPITVAALWVYHHYVNPEWLSILVSFQKQKLTSTGVPTEQVAAQIAQLQQRGGDQPQITNGLVGTLMIGLVISVIITPTIGILGRLGALGPGPGQRRTS